MRKHEVQKLQEEEALRTAAQGRLAAAEKALSDQQAELQAKLASLDHLMGVAQRSQESADALIHESRELASKSKQLVAVQSRRLEEMAERVIVSEARITTLQRQLASSRASVRGAGGAKQRHISRHPQPATSAQRGGADLDGCGHSASLAGNQSGTVAPGGRPARRHRSRNQRPPPRDKRLTRPQQPLRLLAPLLPPGLAADDNPGPGSAGMIEDEGWAAVGEGASEGGGGGGGGTHAHQPPLDDGCEAADETSGDDRGGRGEPPAPNIQQQQQRRRRRRQQRRRGRRGEGASRTGADGPGAHMARRSRGRCASAPATPPSGFLRPLWFLGSGAASDGRSQPANGRAQNWS
eukprot:COSAG01_NODE_9046_length_2571_cov_1.675162_3_plen_351_part_00